MNYRVSNSIKQVKPSPIREMTKIIQEAEDVISFAGGFPYDEYFPSDQLKAAFDQVFASGKQALQYGLTQGYTPLRELVSERLRLKGISSHPDNVLITTGSQQAIDLFSRVMLSPGDVVLTENPTFLAAIQSFESHEAKVVGVDGDQEGMDPEDLENKLKQYRPKFIYVVPTFSNPDGKVWSEERRKSLLELACKYDALILEDDPYGDIQFHENRRYIPIAAMDDHARVLYTGSFSKTVVPALRTGWITGPQPLIQLLIRIKEVADLVSSMTNQQALYYLLKDFDLDRHTKWISQKYYHHMTMMQDSLKSLRREDISWIEPQGGMFLWMKVQGHVDTAELLKKAVKHGVAFIPGAPFYIHNPQKNTMRLNFTNASPEKIKAGMDRLLGVLHSIS
ncbi:PLP-dependent aminotransferase family protein [Ammoniphilus sp. 3BR4]|uniref:aminotransferase-like domain-containing protein n=1 Tax=Ammoniphilus sp. 3BR4 TaxID=3158265 RepID=UPI003465D380